METHRVIDRKTYTDRIVPYIGKNIIKILTGQRRVGKSCILRCIAEKIKDYDPSGNIIDINIEDFAFSHIRDAQALYDEIKNRLAVDRKNYIFVDEVQEVKDFDRVLRSLLLDDKNDIYVTGSNSSMLSSEIASRLAGRSIEVRVHPLSYNEYLEFHSEKPARESLFGYLQYGGLPYLRNLPDRRNWNEYIEGVINAVVFRDVVARHSIRNSDFMQRLLLFLADNIGRMFSAKRISDYLKSQNTPISVSSIQNYLEFIADAFIINKSRRWDLEGKRYFEIGEKFYFEDLGIRNSLVGYKPGDISGLMENAVYNHLLINGYKVKTGVISGSREIDFVAERRGEIKYIQVATSITDSQTASREFGNLETISDNYEKFVITLDDSSPNSYRGIKMMPLQEFLTLML